MWFINFILGSAVAVTLLVLGASAYFDHTASSRMSGIVEVVPLPRAAPRPHKPQTAVVDEEIVRDPKPSKAIKVRHRTQNKGRRATW